MNKNKIKEFAPKARRELIEAVAAKAQILGLSDKKIEPVEVKGDLAIIAGRPFPRQIAPLRRNLEQAVRREGFDQLVERIAFTWFNRFTALRYMELHGFLDHGYRVLSHSKGGNIPEILEHATDLDLTGLDKARVAELRLAGSKDNELYRLLLVAQCNALNTALPFLFERTHDETELLLPDNLLHTDSPLRRLVSEIDEADWSDVEIVGWLYQFYISEKKDAVIGKVVKSQDIPAATQLFTPNWIVKYLTQNTLGRQWMATYPASAIKGKMEFYIEPAEQTGEVKSQLKAITPAELNPEEITFFDPACGSGHILVEAYDLFKQIYEERGYARRDIPRLILEKNLFGLDIDERAAQLAAFALMMRARADDRSLFRAEPPIKLNIMAIKESNGLDIEQIAETLTREKIEIIDSNLKPEQQTLAGFETKPIQKSLVAASKSEIDKATLITFLEFFKDAKTYGSLLRIPERFTASLPSLQKLIDPTKGRDLAGHTAAEELRPFVVQASILATKYDNVVANPPYMGTKGMNQVLKDFAKANFSDTKSDLFAMFIDHGFNLCKPETGFNGMVTMQSWMFLSSYEEFRSRTLAEKSLLCMVHMANGVMGIAFGTAATVFLSKHIPCVNGSFSYVDFCDINEDNKPREFPVKNDRLKEAKPDDFKKIPGSPIAYWVSDGILKTFEQGTPLGNFADVKRGMTTSDNNQFLRFWPEVSFGRSCRNAKSGLEAVESRAKWFPYSKGGGYRKWYGFIEFFINWEESGRDVISFAKTINQSFTRTIVNISYYFLPSVGFSYITSGPFSMRWIPEGFLYDSGGPGIFADERKRQFILACMNSSPAMIVLKLLNPTINLQIADVVRLPLPPCLKLIDDYAIVSGVSSLVNISKSDWDSFEISWDFSIFPLMNLKFRHTSFRLTYQKLRDFWQEITSDMRRLEEENNRIFIKAYSLQGELSPAVSLKDITLNCNPYYRYGKEEPLIENNTHESAKKNCENLSVLGIQKEFPIDEELEKRLLIDTMKEFVSYAVGCMMGRYSLDKAGLIYANASNEGFDPSQYITFLADDDGIVPVCDIDWFPDDATPRLLEFIKTIFGVETLDENLAWFAESFEPKKGETPVETIRRYFSTQFFKNHMQMYKKRPIYWLFSSGKQKAFECLVYLHRYNESTLARMRAQYVTPLQGKLNARIEHLRRETDSAGSTAAKTKLRKEVEMLVKKQTELAKFDEELRHYADQRIKLDLDDGVRVNYGKFGSLLAETKAITGGDID